MKRAVDVMFSSIALICLFPVLVVLSVLIWALVGRPVLFSQMRPGMFGKSFRIYKFRTMRDAFDAIGDPLSDEQRLTRLGRFLRATSLDELPELWNVLKGDMSLVGPRPLLMEYLGRYSPEQQRRHEVKPGITGWAQINGRNNLSWEEKFKLDVWYVDNHSLLLDFKILLLTIWKVVSRQGISATGHATMPHFTGKPEQ